MRCGRNSAGLNAAISEKKNGEESEREILKAIEKNVHA